MKSGISWSMCWFAAAVLWWRCQPAAALLVVPPKNNISAPSDDPGWLNVGDRGVYLGNRWVITAFHVGAGPTIFPGIAGTFNAESGSTVRIQNPTGQGLSQYADILVYRLETDPGLPWITLAAATPPVGHQVVLIGDGAAVEPSATETHWQRTGMGHEFTWTLDPGGNRHGYLATTSRKLWGTNLVENDATFFQNELDANHTVVANSGNGDTISFFTEFDKAGLTDGLATDSEAQALSGDSGSAIFHKDGNGNWTLAGLTHAIGLFGALPNDQPNPNEDQPHVGLSAVYGNFTFAADLWAYRSEILAVTSVPEIGGFWLLGGVAGTVGLWRAWAIFRLKANASR